MAGPGSAIVFFWLLVLLVCREDVKQVVTIKVDKRINQHYRLTSAPVNYHRYLAPRHQGINLSRH
jgi:hypothetical protein